jgi:hypothetical protein
MQPLCNKKAQYGRGVQIFVTAMSATTIKPPQNSMASNNIYCFKVLQVHNLGWDQEWLFSFRLTPAALVS